MVSDAVIGETSVWQPPDSFCRGPISRQECPPVISVRCYLRSVNKSSPQSGNSRVPPYSLAIPGPNVRPPSGLRDGAQLLLLCLW